MTAQTFTLDRIVHSAPLTRWHLTRAPRLGWMFPPGARCRVA